MKQAAYHIWKSEANAKTCAAFKRVRNNAKSIVCEAKEACKKIEDYNFSPREFWFIYSNLAGSSHPSIPFLSDQEKVASTSLAKAELLNLIFTANWSVDAGVKVPSTLGLRTEHA
jgi:hypothetical protein